MNKERKVVELQKELKEKSEKITDIFNDLSKKYGGVSFDFELERVDYISGHKQYNFKITARI